MEIEHSKNCSKVEVVLFSRKNQDHDVFWGLFKSWWITHRGLYPSELMVTDYGFCAFVNQKPVFISYLYPVLGAKSAMQGYQVCAPESGPEERGLAIEAATTKMAAYAKALGYKVLVAYPGNKAILKRLLTAGFVVNDHRVTQVIKEL